MIHFQEGFSQASAEFVQFFVSIQIVYWQWGEGYETVLLATFMDHHLPLPTPPQL